MSPRQRPCHSLNPRFGTAASRRLRQAREQGRRRPPLAVRGPRAWLLGNGLIMLVLALATWVMPIPV
jgi:hypothetical protein